ncbi:MAG: hypothetical protein HWQ41_04410 [Nostoc sp. NOS(2021)]|uniref:hypothetical protein n=1 Tax=Nostoc sp. NOS(2021) TaxID=2815407 RepID=UPI0025E832B6|nr:hypothetical protein [Nostoc sp. NOS(2021)]MBN3894523.1 hypothetical protein [Nostoc sp. NOS(2021)]
MNLPTQHSLLGTDLMLSAIMVTELVVPLRGSKLRKASRREVLLFLLSAEFLGTG